MSIFIIQTTPSGSPTADSNFGSWVSPGPSQGHASPSPVLSGLFFLCIPPSGKLSTYQNCPLEIREAETQSQAVRFQPEGEKNRLCGSILCSKPLPQHPSPRWTPSRASLPQSGQEGKFPAQQLAGTTLLPGATDTTQADSGSQSPSLPGRLLWATFCVPGASAEN